MPHLNFCAKNCIFLCKNSNEIFFRFFFTSGEKSDFIGTSEFSWTITTSCRFWRDFLSLLLSLLEAVEASEEASATASEVPANSSRWCRSSCKEQMIFQLLPDEKISHHLMNEVKLFGTTFFSKCKNALLIYPLSRTALPNLLKSPLSFWPLKSRNMDFFWALLEGFKRL